jgi:ATP-binding protein involved in chromosome partitioning
LYEAFKTLKTNIKMIELDKVKEALSQVQEPDLGKDLMTLNMVKDIVIDGKQVSFTVVLTTPACPPSRI